MEQFLIVAATHFLALLSPGPDFFLVTRTSLASGWKVACGACLGIAAANGVFIVMAFTGITLLDPDEIPFKLLQAAGCCYLIYLGILFIRFAGSTTLMTPGATRFASSSSPLVLGLHAAGMGFLSGILNPKNALFYASLATIVKQTHTSPGWLLLYGSWMFTVVLCWDILVAAMIGNRQVLQRFARSLPWIERLSGAVLLILGSSVLFYLFIP